MSEKEKEKLELRKKQFGNVPTQQILQGLIQPSSRIQNISYKCSHVQELQKSYKIQKELETKQKKQPHEFSERDEKN